MTVNGNSGSAVNYEPNTLGGPVEDPSKALKKYPVAGPAGRNEFEKRGDIDMEQPRALWTKVFKEESRAYLVGAMSRSMKNVRPEIKLRMIALCTRVHPDFGARLAQGLEQPKL